MIHPDSIEAVLVTRGNVDLDPIIASIPYPVTVWDNSKRRYNVGVMGRYAAISETSRPFIYTQDDDCMLTPTGHTKLRAAADPGELTGIMPASHAVGEEHCLVGWGAIFSREAPGAAFARWLSCGGSVRDLVAGHCDMIFGALWPHQRVSTDPALGEWHGTHSMTLEEAEAAGYYVKVMPYMFHDDRAHRQTGHDVRRHRIRYQCRDIQAGTWSSREPLYDYEDAAR